MAAAVRKAVGRPSGERAATEQKMAAAESSRGDGIHVPYFGFRLSWCWNST